MISFVPGRSFSLLLDTYRRGVALRSRERSRNHAASAAGAYPLAQACRFPSPVPVGEGRPRCPCRSARGAQQHGTQSLSSGRAGVHAGHPAQVAPRVGPTHVDLHVSPDRQPIPDCPRCGSADPSARQRTSALGRPHAPWGTTHIGRTTIRDILTRKRVPLALQRSTQSSTWRTFLQHDQHEMLACHFFTVETAWLQTRYVLCCSELGSRRVHGAGCTDKPTTAWVTGYPLCGTPDAVDQ